MSFITRRIELTFRLGKGYFGESGENTVTVRGVRCQARMSRAGGIAMNDLDLRVWGLPLGLMNELWTLNTLLTEVRRNTIIVTAGDDEIGMSTVFEGTIARAVVDGQSAPDLALVVEAHTGLLDALRPLTPTSIKGGADAAFIVSGLAQQMGYTFTNWGVSAQLSNPYLPGTGRDQIYACAKAADFNVAIEGTEINIWPKGGSRGEAAVLISPETGLIGYPSWLSNGVQVTTLFNPAITNGVPIQIDSSITSANGLWTPFFVAHELDSEMPDGRWFTRVEATVMGRAAISSSQ